MNTEKKQAEFNDCVNVLREAILSEKDVNVKVESMWDTSYKIYKPGIVVFNHVDGDRDNYRMFSGGLMISLHRRVMESDKKPILLDSAKSWDFKYLFKNGATVGTGRDSATVISTEKIYAAALAVADILVGIEKAANQELGWKSQKAGVDFYLTKALGLEEAISLMKKLKELPTSFAAGRYSEDNTATGAWYAKKELFESFWQFGKDRRTDLFERRTGIHLPLSNKEMPLLKAEIDRLLEPVVLNLKPTLLGDVIDFGEIRTKINL